MSYDGIIYSGTNYGGSSKGLYVGTYFYHQLYPLVYTDPVDNKIKSTISSVKISNYRGIKFYKSIDCSGNYWLWKENYEGLPSNKKNEYKSLEVITTTEPFENKLSLYRYDNTNNYLLALLIIIGIFYTYTFEIAKKSKCIEKN